MSLHRQTHRMIVVLLGLIIGTSLSGCGDLKNREPLRMANVKADSEDMDPDAISADYILSDKDLSVFQIGRLKQEILDDIHGVGNLDMACLRNEKEIGAIGYGVFGGPFSDDSRGNYVWAIFIDDKFEKLVVPEFKKPTTLGNFDSLEQAIKSEPFNIEEMCKSAPGDVAATPKSDLGLSAAWLALGAGARARHEHGLKRNVVLRSQFNALRLSIGMDERTVGDTLKAVPLLKGSTATGTFHIYGSEEYLDVIAPLHHAIIVTMFSSGKLTGIYSGACTVSGSDKWQHELCEIYSNVCP